MKKIAFIGAYDKTDFLLYVAKIMTVLGKKVLIIDSTIMQKAKYVVPVIHPTTTYVTEFEEIDVAVGFSDMDEVRAYLGYSTIDEFPYDYCLLDVDTCEGYYNFGTQEAIKNYFVTSFDVYSLKRGIEALSGLQQKIILTKILFSRDMLQEEDDYLNFLSFYYSIQWNGDKIYFPFDNGDSTVIIENQRAAKISFRNLSTEYKDGLLELAQQIVPETRNGEIKRIIKNI